MDVSEGVTQKEMSFRCLEFCSRGHKDETVGRRTEEEDEGEEEAGADAILV